MAQDNPTQADVNALMVLMQTGKYAEAESKCRKFIKRFPKVLGFYDTMSKAQIAQGNFRGVAKTLEKAIEINPAFVDGEYNLGVAYMNINRLDKALATFSSVVSKRTDFFDAYNNLGACYIELQRFDEGLEAYEKAVELKPDYVPALRNYGAALRDVGRLDEAEKVLEKIPELQPEFALGFLSLGATKAKLEKMDEASECLKKALELDPEMREAHYELGKVFKHQGDMNKALEHFEKVDSMIARVQVLELLHDMGNRDELLPRLKKLCDAEPKNLRAAAFSAFASHQYDMDNMHSFARDPMELVSVSDLSDRLDYTPRMLTELMLAADDLTTVWQHATTRGGTQTHGNLFDPALQNEQFSKLEKLIRKELRGYREKFKDCSDGIIKEFPRDFTLKGWRVKLMKAGFQKPHIHSGGWISGVLYLKIPKQIKDNKGSIAFSLHGYDYRKEKDDIPYKEHAPSEGELILFPSSLFHWTIPFESDEERQCIAFDVVPA